MSKLIDKLTEVTKPPIQPMGFLTAKPSGARPKMALIARLVQTETVEGLVDYVAGADAVLLPVTESGNLPKMVRSLAAVPWGVRLGDTGNGDVKPLLKAGCDFIIFPASAPVTAPQEGLGKILQIEPSLSNGLVRAINSLPVDAVFIAENRQEGPLTWQNLILFQHMADLLDKPLLVPAPLNATSEELQALLEADVCGVIVEAGIEQAGKLRELHQAIGKLTPPSPKKRGRLEPVVPRVIGETTPVVEEEQEEEEE